MNSKYEWRADVVTITTMVLGLVKGEFPFTTPSVGQVWPHPQQVDRQETYMIIRPDNFRFSASGYSCDILEEALQRYINIMFSPQRSFDKTHQGKFLVNDEGFNGYLETVNVDLQAECELYPHLGMEEYYQIQINIPDAPGVGAIQSQTIWGILRGLESFSQLLIPEGTEYKVYTTLVSDFPRFPHRGLLLDTSRHFLPLSEIYKTLDLLAMNKFNVFHWHIVDDHSFPYQSDMFPALSERGSYLPSFVYTSEDVANIVEYARIRGIRVIPEFDTPGHTQSWGPGKPGLLTMCYDGEEPDGEFGPIDPTNEANYDFLTSFFNEITQLFPDHFVHLGGDEVDTYCWESNPNITRYMKEHGISGQYDKLQEMYITRLIEIISNLPTKNGYLAWQDVFDEGVLMSGDPILQVWREENWYSEMKKVTEAGYQTILSACWYLGYMDYGQDWKDFYMCDPFDFGGTEHQKSLVIGGEACLWGEYVDETNLIPRTWPRASAIGEKLWSAENFTNDNKNNKLTKRLEEFRCKLYSRGYMAEPLGPSFCRA